jgi:AcrR family transcriptional regulator
MIAPRPHESKQTSPEETRERIIAAARETIARKGKRGATTREIADAAGVNEATLFRHFGNKEQLLIDVARKFCPEAKLRELIVTLHGPVEEDLYQLARAMNDHLEGMSDLVRWSLVEQDYEESIFAREAWRPQTAVRAAINEFMDRRIEAGELQGNPDELAAVLMGMVFARVIARGKFPQDSLIWNDTDYALRFFVNVFLDGVRSK